MNLNFFTKVSLIYASLRKQPTFSDATTGFPAKLRLSNKRRNSVLMTCHYSDLSTVLLIGHTDKFASASQKHYQDLGGDTSSVWNFCARFSDVISRGNQW